MRIRTAILTGVTGLMLTVGMGQEASAQPGYRYGNESSRRYVVSDRRQARQLVRQAYRDVLLREPDPAGMRQYMDAMMNRGWSLADVRRSLASSREYAQRFGRAGYRRDLRWR